jgi:TetR/AcrR family transcriptional repressor of bet genes
MLTFPRLMPRRSEISEGLRGSPAVMSSAQTRAVEGLKGLADVMAERGYAKATVQAIARAAGLTPGLVHYHFESKQQILIALIETLAETVRARLRAADASPEHRLEAAIDALVGTRAGIEARAVACWVVIGAEAVREPAVRNVYQAVMQQLIAEFEGLLREAMQKEGGPGDGAHSAAVAIVAAIEGFFRLAAGAPSCVPPGTAAASIRAIAEGFVAADKRG